MNKKLNKIIILAIFTMIYTYGIFWLPNDLFLVLTMVSLGGLVLVIPILFFLVFIKSIRYVFRNGDRMGLVPIGILILTFVLFKFFFPADIQRNMNYDLTIDAYKEVVQLIKDGELERDSDNHVMLTGEYQKLSEVSYAYVPELEGEDLLVGFVYEAGFPDEDLWLVYSNGGEELIKENIDANLYRSIKKKEENWYFVQFN